MLRPPDNEEMEGSELTRVLLQGDHDRSHRHLSLVLGLCFTAMGDAVLQVATQLLGGDPYGAFE